MFTSHDFRFDLANSAATRELGAKLAALLQRGDVVFLIGELGAGKTCFAQGVIARLVETANEITSPTYNLVHQWQGEKGPVYHADLYRLETMEQVLELGLEEGFENGISLIEWPDRMGALAPENRLDILISKTISDTSNGADEDRQIQMRASSKEWEERLHGL